MVACPQKKRGLSGGESGKDVQAVQRAVFKARAALGQVPQNARNGTYGDFTVLDVQAVQRAEGIEATGKTGQPTLAALWPYVDAYGASLYFKAKIGAAPELPYGELYTGMSGDRVRALQQMLWRALGNDSANIRNGVYGAGVEADVKLFREVADVGGDPGRVDPDLWAMLYGFADDYARELAAEAAPSGGTSVRSDLVTWAEWYVSTGGSYLQARPYQRDDPPVKPLKNDCSGSIHHLFKLAGGPDPSGNDFNGAGYTGTMEVRGTRRELSASPAAGDCVFYGGSSGYGPTGSTHVAMHLGDGRLFTFGSNPPTITSYASYWTSGRRGDIGARRYFS